MTRVHTGFISTILLLALALSGRVSNVQASDELIAGLSTDLSAPNEATTDVEDLDPLDPDDPNDEHDGGRYEPDMNDPNAALYDAQVTCRGLILPYALVRRDGAAGC